MRAVLGRDVDTVYVEMNQYDELVGAVTWRELHSVFYDTVLCESLSSCQLVTCG